MSRSPKVERKLAAIMFTDIAGYTESMSYDENQALTAVRKKRSVLQPLIKEYNIQDKVNAMSDKSKQKFINYPIPKIILEEYNKIK